MPSNAPVHYVVGRCPGCAAEYAQSAGGMCPACEIRLRPWCRIHSRKIGWLDGATCRRCAEPPASARAAPGAGSRDPDGISGNVFVMLLTLLITGVLGGLMGIATGYQYLSYGRGTVPETPLQFGKAGLIVGLIFGFVVYARYVASLSGHAPPPPLPRPAPASDPPPLRRPAPPSAAVLPARAPAVPVPPPPGRSQWPGGRSPREILRGPPKTLAELGLPETVPPPNSGDIVGLALGGTIFGMLAGWVAASVLGAGAAGASLIGATVMGLGGLFVGIIRYFAILHANQSGDYFEEVGGPHHDG